MKIIKFIKYWDNYNMKKVNPSILWAVITLIISPFYISRMIYRHIKKLNIKRKKELKKFWESWKNDNR